MALAPLRALTGLSVLRERSQFSRDLPYGVEDFSMRLSHASLAGDPAGVVAANASAAAADSATRGVCISAAGVVVVVGFGHAYGGAAGCPAGAAGVPAVAAGP
eukprot:7930767-Pyramimonas_sp.AAC.1